MAGVRRWGRVLGRRAALRGLALSGLAVALAWYAGADLSHAVAVGVAVSTVAVLLDAVDVAVPDADWPPEDLRRPGSRRDVVELARSLRGPHGAVGDVALGHVRALAARRLAAHRLDPGREADRAAIEQLIGRDAFAVIATGRGRRRPSLRALEHCLDALDALDARPAAPGGVTPTRNGG